MVRFNFFIFFIYINFFLLGNSLKIPNILKDINIEAKNGIRIPNVLVKNKKDIFQISSFFSKTPIILVLVYYKCSMLCERVLLNLSKTLLSINKKNLNYSVLIIGFDYNEKEEDVENMLFRLKINKDFKIDNKWNFLILNDKISSLSLTESLGFKYKYNKKINEYIHSAGIFILNSDMILTSIIWGLEFNEDEIFNFLNFSKQSFFSNSKYLLLNCFHYEVDKERYGSHIIFFIKITIFLFIFLFLFLLYKPFNNFKKNRKRV